MRFKEISMTSAIAWRDTEKNQVLQNQNTHGNIESDG